MFGVLAALGAQDGPKTNCDGCRIPEGRFEIPFWHPSWGPSWSQVAIKIHFEASETISEHLGFDFGGLVDAKTQSKSELTIRILKT